MNADKLKRILISFADSPADVDISKGELLVEIQNTIIECTVTQKSGLVYIEEGGRRQTAEKWVIDRLGQLPLLADRIRNVIQADLCFVTPRASSINRLEDDPKETSQDVDDTLLHLRDMLGQRPSGTSSIVYLTSDAGEGKTTIINQLARHQARGYKRKETDWLLLPITLGGRPFLRFDDVIIGALMNRFRFQYLYYEAFVELVRLGALIPAFDGFEEMFIESSTGEAVSALSNFVGKLHSEGTVLVSARKAYFEYQSLDTQARLFDSLDKQTTVSFSRVSLERWDRKNFITYCERRDFPEPEGLYSDVQARFPEQHPLLTRAVLVKRLVDVASGSDRNEVLTALGNAPHDYFAQFVDAILDREANEKWIDRSGDASAHALLSKAQHHQLLALIAREMWIGRTDSLKEEVLDLLAELFCEDRDLSVVVSRQVKERLKQHALLVSPDPGQRLYAFDHEEFWAFFLGEDIGQQMVRTSRSPQDMLNVCRIGPLPEQALDAAVHYWNRHSSLNAVPPPVVSLIRACKSEGPASFTKENLGGLLIRILDNNSNPSFEIDSITFPSDSLAHRNLEDVSFRHCYFQPTRLNDTCLVNCVFNDCHFDRLEMAGNTKVEGSQINNTKVRELRIPTIESGIFDPASIKSRLLEKGFVSTDTVATAITTSVEPDEHLVLAERFFRIFLRATEINENIIRTKLGKRSNEFFSDALPKLISKDVVTLIPYLGAGKQRRFRLNIPMSQISEALVQCGGNFAEFLRITQE